MADVALVPQGLIFQRSQGVGAQQARKTAHVLGRNGVLFVRHGRRTLLALGKTFFNFKHFGALQVAQFHAQAFHTASQHGQRGKEVRVAVALDDLGGVRVNLKLKVTQGALLKLGRQERVGPYRARNFAHADAFHTGFNTRQMAFKFGVEPGHFKAKAGGFGVDAVGAAHAQHALVAVGKRFDGGQKPAYVFKNQAASLHKQEGVGRVHNVGRRAAKMNVARGFCPHLFFQRGQKGDDVVAGHFFDGQYAIHVNGGLGLNVFYRFSRDAAHVAPGPANSHFHIKPCLIAVFEGPNAAHFLTGVAINHGCLMKPRWRPWWEPTLRPLWLAKGREPPWRHWFQNRGWLRALFQLPDRQRMRLNRQKRRTSRCLQHLLLSRPCGSHNRPHTSRRP